MSPLGFALVALAGLVMGVAPSSLPLASVVAGYSGGQSRERDVNRLRKELSLPAGFILGMVKVDAVIGVCAGVPVVFVGPAAETIKGVPRFMMWVVKIERVIVATVVIISGTCAHL